MEVGNLDTNFMIYFDYVQGVLYAFFLKGRLGKLFMKQNKSLMAIIYDDDF